MLQDKFSNQLELTARIPALTNARVNLLPFIGRVDRGGFLRNPNADGERPPRREGDKEEGHGDDGGKPEYKPELLCRTYAGDMGARPLAPGIVFWESPDIWVVAPDGSDIPIVGQVNKVFVHVWNIGLAPTWGAHVQLYWCNPSVGVNLANATQIGPTQVIPLNAGEHTILTFDWVPVFVNNGHECLVAQVYDPVADNLVAPFNPVQDRHVGQQNISQLRVPAGHQLKVTFSAANLSPHLATSVLELVQLKGDTLQEVSQVIGRGYLAAAPLAHAQLMVSRTRPVRPLVDLSKFPAAAVFRASLEPAPPPLMLGMLSSTLAALPIAKTRRQKQVATAEQETYSLTAIQAPEFRALPMETRQTVELAPGQETLFTLAITLPERAIKGTSLVYRVIEHAGDRISGGMTYIVHVT